MVHSGFNYLSFPYNGYICFAAGKPIMYEDEHDAVNLLFRHVYKRSIFPVSNRTMRLD